MSLVTSLAIFLGVFLVILLSFLGTAFSVLKDDIATDRRYLEECLVRGFKDLETTLDRVKSEVAGVEPNISAIGRDIRSIREGVLTASDLAGIESTVGEIGRDVASAEKVLESFESTLTDIKSAVGEIKREVGKIELNVDSATTDVSSIRTKVWG